MRGRHSHKCMVIKLHRESYVIKIGDCNAHTAEEIEDFGNIDVDDVGLDGTKAAGLDDIAALAEQ